MPSRAHITAVAAALLLPLGGSGSRADETDDALDAIPAYAAAISALSQNKNEVASIRLREILPDAPSKLAKLRVLTRIAEAELRGKRYEQVLALFSEPGLATDPQAKYWQALALVGAGRAGDADKILAEIALDADHPYWPEAILSRTSLLLRFGASEEAIKLLTALIESGREPYATRARLRAAEIRLDQEQWGDVSTLLSGLKSPEHLPSLQHKYLQARLNLGLKDWPAAIAQLRELNAPETLSSLPPGLRDSAILGLATALSSTGENDAAIRLLKNFIESQPDSPNLTIAFDSLDDLGAFHTPNLDEQLVNWSNSPSRELAATATYFLAVAQSFAVDDDTAATTLETIRNTFPDHPIAERALLRLCEIYVADANKQQALAVLADLRKISRNPAVLARIDFIEARAHFAAGDFKLAADKFALAAGTDKSTAATATFNSAIAALKANDLDTFNQRRQLLDDLGETTMSGDLELERDLFHARQNTPGVSTKLTQFLASYPNHPRRAEALLALAYLDLIEFPPKIVSARRHVDEARSAPITPDLAEEADYVTFWIEASAHNNPAAIASAQQFIKSHPDSARAPEILFKLGGIHFRDGSFSAAQTQYEKLALDYPTSPRAEIALFTAGRAAMRTGTPASLESAISIFTHVADLGGQFATAAKLQQALVRHSQLKEVEAITILDAILLEKPEGELLFSTLITRGECLFVLGEKDPASLAESIAVFDSVARHPDATTSWLNQSLTRKGNCLERSGKIDEALVAYEDVIARPRPPLENSEVPDYVWYYKAGFAAIRIYEEKKNWIAAIRIADTLAAIDGPNSQAARELSEQLETKNFIWRE